MAINNVMTMIYNVLTIFPKIPKLPVIVLGVVIKKFKDKAGNPLIKTNPIILTNTATDKKALK